MEGNKTVPEWDPDVNRERTVTNNAEIQASDLLEI